MKKRHLFWAAISIAFVISIIFAGSIFETVEKGTYKIKQAAVSGTMTAHMNPGMFGQVFGDIQLWPKAETFFFTADADEGTVRDQSIEVRFADGSICHISGTMRIQLPVSEVQAIELITKHGFRSYRDLEARFMLPVVRNALRLTANLMSARESYSEKRTDFTFWAWDMIQNGLYETEEVTKEVKDLVSGDMIKKNFKIIKRDKTGVPLYQKNPIEGLGLLLANFEIKSFVYSKVVQEQIAEQQKNIMAIATAKAESQRAEQDKIKAVAQGKAKVATARYEKEQEKVKAVTDAEKLRDVAKLDKEAAAYTKAKLILLGEGEAKRKRLVMVADGALRQKLDAYIQVMGIFAQEFGKQKWVPEIQMGGGRGKTGSSVTGLMELLTAKTAQDLGLDLKMKKTARSSARGSDNT